MEGRSCSGDSAEAGRFCCRAGVIYPSSSSGTVGRQDNFRKLGCGCPIWAIFSPHPPGVRSRVRRSRRMRSCSCGLAAATQDIWKSWPEPSSGRPASGSPRASVTTPPASSRHRTGGREVVGRVVQNSPAADLLEPRAQRRGLLDHPGADVEIGVELAGDQPGEVERRRAEVEHRPADRGGVDQLAQDRDQGYRGAAAEAEGPEHAGNVGVRAEDGRRPTADAVADLYSRASLCDERGAALDLDHAADVDVAHDGDAVAERRRRDGDAA